MLYYAHQYVTTTLSKAGGLNDSDTEGIVLSSTEGIDTSKPGIVLLSYQNPLDITKAEWITYTSINIDKELQGVQRGQEGSSPKNHDNGSAIAFPISASHINNLNDAYASLDEANSGLKDAFEAEHTEDGRHKIVKRIVTVASAATHTIDADTTDEFIVTAQAAAVTFAAPTGTPTEGQMLIIRIKDNGTARGITWNAIFRASSDLARPTTTTVNKTLYLGYIYNSTDDKWDLLALLNNI